MNSFFYRAAATIVAPFRYAEREAKLMKEYVKEDIQAYVAIALKLMVAGIAAMLFLLFISIAVANWINAAMDSNIVGYAIVGAFYLVVAGVMYMLKLADDKKKREVVAHRRAMYGKPVHS
jgi:TRAP-type C4-dicarboxylate transport system permease large subunit